MSFLQVPAEREKKKSKVVIVSNGILPSPEGSNLVLVLSCVYSSVVTWRPSWRSRCRVWEPALGTISLQTDSFVKNKQQQKQAAASRKVTQISDLFGGGSTADPRASISPGAEARSSSRPSPGSLCHGDSSTADTAARWGRRPADASPGSASAPAAS